MTISGWDYKSSSMLCHPMRSSPALGLSPPWRFLWSANSTPDLSAASIDNRHLLDAVRALLLVRDDDNRVERKIDYRNLGAEELGSIYESLLELHAEVDVDAGAFSLGYAAGNERKTTGSYYTPTPLIVELLDSALDPVLNEAAAAENPEQALLSLKVVDPACGSGHFLIAAERIAYRLASARVGGGNPHPMWFVMPSVMSLGAASMASTSTRWPSSYARSVFGSKRWSPGDREFLDHRIAGNALWGRPQR